MLIKRYALDGLASFDRKPWLAGCIGMLNCSQRVHYVVVIMSLCHYDGCCC